MSGFCPVFETKGAPAGFAAEGEEVELAAEFVLAVSADGFQVFVGHLGVRFGVLARP